MSLGKSDFQSLSAGKGSHLFWASLLIVGISGCAHSVGHQSMGGEPGVLHQGHNQGPMKSQAKKQEKVTGTAQLQEALGIELVSLRPTGGGQLLDLRYRITNPALAKEVTKRNTNLEVHIIDVKTGHSLSVPLTHLGFLRTQTPNPKTDRLYYALFDNPNGVVQSGSEVSIRFGSINVDGWRVE